MNEREAQFISRRAKGYTKLIDHNLELLGRALRLEIHSSFS